MVRMKQTIKIKTGAELFENDTLAKFGIDLPRPDARLRAVDGYVGGLKGERVRRRVADGRLHHHVLLGAWEVVATRRGRAGIGVFQALRASEMEGPAAEDLVVQAVDREVGARQTARAEQQEERRWWY